MKEEKKLKSWIEKKLENPKFKKNFDKEYEKISIGEQLAQMRISAGLTQSELAKKVGTTASAISRFESCEYDRYEVRTLQKIAKACGCMLQLVFETASKFKRVL